VPNWYSAPPRSWLDAHSGGIIDVMNEAASLTCDRLAALLEREGCPADRYGIGRHGKYQDQAFVVERWSNRWVVYYIERAASPASASTRPRTQPAGTCWRGLGTFLISPAACQRRLPLPDI
jgi:hypothetical protein